MNTLPFNIQEKVEEVRAMGLEVLNLSGIPLTSEILFDVISELHWLKELHLVNSRLINLPSNLLNLSALEVLNLANNNLINVPELIFQLINLKNINLSYNMVEDISTDISNLSNLEILNLSSNNLQEISTSIFQLSNLKDLTLSHNRVEDIPIDISNLSNLEILNLSSNNLREIPITILQVTNLREINFSNNKIDNLPANISNLSNLEELILSINNLKELPESIFQLVNLKRLVLSQNKIENLPTNIGNLSNLEILHLSNNKINALPESITQLSNLLELSLSNNRLKILPHSISNLHKLQSLMVHTNRIQDLPLSITQLFNLQELGLSQNRIEALPDDISNLSQLKTLNLSANKIETLPESIVKLSNLNELSLAENNIEILPDDFSSLSNLRKLNLADNNIKKLPESISSLVDLNDLRCSYNSLNEIPESISSLSKLITLSLAGNNLREFPECITKLYSLKELRISNNQLINISENIGDIPSLEYFSASYNQIKKLPESIFNLSNLSYLSLRNNEILDLPDFFSKLPKLKELKINNNPYNDSDEFAIEKQVINRPISKRIKINKQTDIEQPDVHNKIEEVKEKKLKVLNLSGKNLSALPQSIFKLNWLEELDISNNQITELPIELLELSNLLKINLNGNPLRPPLSDISKEGLGQIFQYLDALDEASYQIEQARNPKNSFLDLSNLNLIDIPDEVFELNWLEELDLSNNQIKFLPYGLLNLPKLSKLHLVNNPLEDALSKIVLEGIDKVFQYLHLQKRIEDTRSHRLKILDLSGLALKYLPFEILDMNWLEELDLSNNELKELPDELLKLSNLKSLILFRNQISSLPKTFSQFNKLKHLNLSGNQLRELPDDFGKLVGLDSLSLLGNPLEVPPIEVAKKGIKSISQYFNQLGEVGKSYLYEAKLLLVGEPGAGKTTLARKLKNPTAPLPLENESTKGIDIITWAFPQLDKPDFRVNIWDFAGQEIYYATHRFFLTHNALYLLVADTRKDDTYFDYWLNIISLLSQDSPVLIIANEKDDRYRHFNTNGLRGYFHNLKNIIRTNLANRRGLQEIYKEIEHYITNLPHVGKILPSTWVRVREVLEKTKENYIAVGKFFHICEKEGIKENSDKLQLSDYLHTIGVILHYQNDPILKNTIFLNPEWCTSAIYKALDTKEIIKNNGLFTKNYLTKIWKDTEYSAVLDELLQLMIKFNLCYPLPSTKDTYIVPQLLPEERMPFEWDENENLHLQYEYEFMPKGMLWLFIIAVHTFIKDQVYVWRSGVIITKDGATAEIIEHYLNRRITIRIFGKNKRDLMSVIRYEFEKIHDIYHQLEYTELVPCNCTSCRDNDNPHFYDLRELLERIQNKKDRIECRKKPYNMVKVRELLDDILDVDVEYSSDAQKKYQMPYTQIENAYFQGTNPIHTSMEVDMTKNITISEVQGSTINIDSVFENVNQVIKNLPKDNQKEKDELDDLIKQLKFQLSNVPPSKEDELDKITKRLDAFLKEATDKKPDKDVVQVNGESLIKAAKNLESAIPSVLSIARKIVEFVTLLAFKP